MHLRIETKRFDATPPEWLVLGSQCGELANEWSGRGDIIAFVGKGAGMGIAAALWNPDLAEMELNVDQAFGESAKPEFIGDLTDRDTQFEHPAACGAVLHESMHAKHSKYDLSEVRGYHDKRVATIVELFEELRIETRGVEQWPRNRSFLRACALKLVVSDMQEAAERDKLAGAMQISKLMLLTMGRVSAGVLDEDDVLPVTKAAIEVFGEPLVDRLRLLWEEATNHRVDDDWAPLRVLAERWVKELEDEGHKTQPSEEEKAAAQRMMEAFGEIMDQLGEMAADAETRARSEAIDQSEIEDGEREAAAAAAREREDKTAQDEATKVFGKGTAEMAASATRSRLVEERPPKDAERAAAVALGRMLEKAKYRDRVVVRRTSQAPPGRLRSRAMVQAAAEQDRGGFMTAEPWVNKRRFHIEDPNLTIGMMTDISGSMRSAMEPMAAANWIFSEAGRRIQARVASVYFGNSVFPGLSPGEHLEKVKIYTAADGTEMFDSAFKALNGRLRLLGGSGARLLVVVSDLHHTDNERRAARKWFARCAQDGIAVLVMPFEARGYFIDETIKGLPVRALKDVSNPTEAAMEIGHAAAEALTQAGNRA